MSRIGKLPIEIPTGVTVDLSGKHIKVKGPKGELEMNVHADMSLGFSDGEGDGDKTIVVERPTDEKRHRALHGLTRALVANMVQGVHQGFTRTLEIVGVGYRAENRGNGLVLNLGFSHPIEFAAPDGVALDAPSPTTIVVSGPDKQAVGHTAAVIRAFRPPEPYKGKGIRYQGEQIRRKAGKTAGA